MNQFGLIGDWDCATANVQGQTFHLLLRQYDGQMIVLADWGGSPGGGGSGQCADLPVWAVECADASGNGVCNDECEVGF